MRLVYGYDEFDLADSAILLTAPFKMYRFLLRRNLEFRGVFEIPLDFVGDHFWILLVVRTNTYLVDNEITDIGHLLLSRNWLWNDSAFPVVADGVYYV
jgi:hypothetical protein